MDTFRAKLLRRREVAERTMAFHFEKPGGFQYRAGQYVDMTLIDPPETDVAGSTRTFTLASAPYEEELVVATRMRGSAFKRVLERLGAGQEVMVEGPMGSFTLHTNASKPAILLAGGIGITPFLSMAREAAHERLAHSAYLFYGNHRPEDAAYLEELGGIEKDNPRFHLIATMDDMPRSRMTWKGETGVIDAPLLRRHVETFHGPIFYIAGPPGMVAAMRQMLLEAGVDEDDIRAEDFAGY